MARINNSKRCLKQARYYLIKILDNYFEFPGCHCLEGMESPFWWCLNYADYYSRIEAEEDVKEKDFQCDKGKLYDAI